ncbi:MAG: TRAP transporter small permease subunit [Deltaproteobacteria bacterium]|nr:TRAP transporter small permease subunit [Deltaproteobacteria bacterium]
MSTKPSSQEKGAVGALERFIEGFGRLVSYLCAVLVAVIVIQVVARYVFGRGFVVLEELEWHLYAVGFLIGMSYCAVKDANVRMDLIYRGFSSRTKAWLEIFTILALVLPFVVVMVIHGWNFFAHSWTLGESSDAPLGLPYRWIIKGFLPFSLVLLGLAGAARFFRAIEVLRGDNAHGSD